MKLSEVWNRYRDYTRDVTEHSRKLGFAAAAICWFFKTENFTFPSLILLSLTFVVSFFALDLAQYVLAAKRIKTFARQEEKKHWKEKRKIDVNTEVPESLDKPVQKLFTWKLVALFLSFGFLIAEFLRRLFLIN
jgi:hypothetical protein